MNKEQLRRIVKSLPSDAKEIIVKDRRAGVLYFGTDQDQPGLMSVPCNPKFYSTRFRFAIPEEKA